MRQGLLHFSNLFIRLEKGEKRLEIYIRFKIKEIIFYSNSHQKFIKF